MTTQPRQLHLPADAVKDLADGDFLLMVDLERHSAVGLIRAQLPRRDEAESARGAADLGADVLYLNDFDMVNLLTGRTVEVTRSSGLSYLITPGGVEEEEYDDPDQD